MLAAFRWSHSTSGFQVTGPGLSLLLDRYLTRFLPSGPGVVCAVVTGSGIHVGSMGGGN